MSRQRTQLRAARGTFLRREIRAVREPFRLLRRWKELRRAPRGNQVIVVMPGYTTGDLSTFALRRFLRSRGHRAHGWGLGMNRGNVRANLPKVVEVVAARHAEHGEVLVLIGWSLGGVFAREVARRHPELVSEVLTMASPVRDTAEVGSDGRPRPVIRQRITAFFTKRDGVVDWRACLDDINPDVDHIEVESSHAGITLDPDVWLEIAERLADRQSGH